MSQLKLGDFWKAVPKSTVEVNWTIDEQAGLMVCTRASSQSDTRTRIAAFDLVLQIICKRRFSQHEADWQFLLPEVPRRLAELHAQGYAIVIFTNQAALDPHKDPAHTERTIFQAKICDLMGKLSSIDNLILIAATRHNAYRKPRTAMWQHYCTMADCDADLEHSFYVGDAAGRPKGWRQGASQDFAATDRKFALNVGLRFFTPEEFFLGHPEAVFDLGPLEPAKLLTRLASDTIFKPHPSKEMLILVGSPASGKSSFFHNHLEPLGYHAVNQDTLKTRARCIDSCKSILKKQISCVIDNTNPSVSGRAEYIALAKAHGYHVRCLIFRTSDDLVQHLDNFRAITQQRDTLPRVAFLSFKKFYQEPSLAEGFDEILDIDFSFHLQDQQHISLFKQHLY